MKCLLGFVCFVLLGESTLWAVEGREENSGLNGEVESGEWLFSTQGELGSHGVDKQKLTQNSVLRISHEKKEKIISGTVFGLKILKSKLISSKKNEIFMIMECKVDRVYQIKWKGKLSSDRKRIIDGVFSFPLGKGRFEARHTSAVSKENA